MTSPTRVTRWRRGGIVSAAVLALLGGVFTAPALAAANDAPDVPTAPLITTDTTWRYLDDNTDPARGAEDLRAWTAPTYDDADWKTATGSFGAKRGALAPVGPQTPRTLLTHYVEGTQTAIPTYFFRTTFTLDEGVAEQVSSLTSTVTYDDALVVWINGTKAASFVDGRITGTTNLEYAGDSNGDPLTSSFSAEGAVLRDGENTIAVALYQDRASSSDIFFDMPELRLIPASDGSGPVVAPPTRVILTPTETPSTSQSFSWLAGDASHTVGQVEIGTVGGSDTRVVDAYDAGVVNGNPNHHFSATVDGLSPATDYRYRVGLPGSWSDWFEFRTEDPGATDFQFVYYGDAQIGLDTTWPSVVAQAEQKAPRSIGSVHAGDLINTSSNENEWLNWFKGMKDAAVRTNVMAAPGNHEYSGDKLLAAWKANFEYPHNNPTDDTIGELAALAQGDDQVARQYRAYFDHWARFAQETVYFTDYQDVRFITLNATRDTTFLTPSGLPLCVGTDCPSLQVDRIWTKFQAAWLDLVLKDSPSKWNVVTFHQPVFSASSGRDEPVLRSEWLPVFQDNDIDLVLMGHDHVYSRGYVNTDATDTPGLTTGPVYVVSNSGAKHYDLAPADDNVWTRNGATQVLRGQGVTTYQVIDVTHDALVYRSYLAEKTGSATTDLPVGAVYDEFTVTKTDAGEKWVTEAGMEPPIPADPPALAPITSEAAAGSVLALRGTGFAANEQLALELHSDPIPLGTVTADADGAFDAEVTIPADVTPGTHALVAVRADGTQVSADLTVTPAETGPDAGSDASGTADSGAAGTADASGTADAGASGTADSGATGTADAGAAGTADAGSSGTADAGASASGTADAGSSADSSSTSDAGSTGSADAGATGTADSGATGTADSDATGTADTGATGTADAGATADAGSAGSASAAGTADASAGSAASASAGAAASSNADAAATGSASANVGTGSDASGSGSGTGASATASGGSSGGTGSGSRPSTGLPATGADSTPFLAVGALLLLGGLVLVAVRRRTGAR
ncbi:fibronectin type III domain-containing protein [Microbacterium resistens]|uniref:Fibronectin type III domain-containing protein n=1 Tax=Microbacterium resistens TaxID=156977 RepID=A0ABY3RP89_9MICO|nr:FN3 domain-containing metallophosphoesterase family protein [Microbacterium resistens]UGS25709.1 fibronectin type III domain-containing protein [Microbacterium resistens]